MQASFVDPCDIFAFTSYKPLIKNEGPMLGTENVDGGRLYVPYKHNTYARISLSSETVFSKIS